MAQNASKQGKLDNFAAIFLFIFLPCMWGLGLQNDSPFQERKRHININKYFRWLPGRGGSPDRVGGGGVSRPVAMGQKFMCCVRNPRNINVFVQVPGREESGSWPGGSVTGVTEKLFMCQCLCAFSSPLNWYRQTLFLGGVDKRTHQGDHATARFSEGFLEGSLTVRAS